MNVTIWGSRGSVASPGRDTLRYGGNTACVEVRGDQGTRLVLDAGTGIRLLSASLPAEIMRVDLLLTHLHMDHIQGLGFFAPLRREGVEVHIWGPEAGRQSLRARLGRYLSPPLFPVHIREMPCNLSLHELPGNGQPVEIGEFRVWSAAVCHPDPTIGYRIESPGCSVAYLPDHEPALGKWGLDLPGEWVSGYSLARGVDLLIHDAQYTDSEYEQKAGWGHSSMRHAFEFAALAGARTLVPFHHDPWRDDDSLDRLLDGLKSERRWPFEVAPAVEGNTFRL